MANRHSIEAADKADYYLETMQRLCELYIQKRGGISNMLDSIEDGFILVALEQVKAHFLYDEFGAVKILLSMLESKQLEIRYIACCEHLPLVLPTLDINALKEIAD